MEKILISISGKNKSTSAIVENHHNIKWISIITLNNVIMIYIDKYSRAHLLKIFLNYTTIVIVYIFRQNRHKLLSHFIRQKHVFLAFCKVCHLSPAGVNRECGVLK